MTLSHNRKRALRIAFIAILVFSAGEVVWWMLDQRRMVRREAERIAALHDANRQAAERLLADGVSPERVAGLLPGARCPPASGHRRATRLRRDRKRAWTAAAPVPVGGCLLSRRARWLRRGDQPDARRRGPTAPAAAELHRRGDARAEESDRESPARRRDDRSASPRTGAARRAGEADARRHPPPRGHGRRILDTATLEAGRLHLRKERLPLARVVAAVAEEFAERAAERGVRSRAAIRRRASRSPPIRRPPIRSCAT